MFLFLFSLINQIIFFDDLNKSNFVIDNGTVNNILNNVDNNLIGGVSSAALPNRHRISTRGLCSQETKRTIESSPTKDNCHNEIHFV